jgi:hypothetical protein
VSSRTFGLAAGWWTLSLTAALLVMLIAVGGLDAWFILVAPAAGGLVALRWPERRDANLLAFLLVLLGMSFMLIGGYGLLYLPSLALLIVAMAARHPATT